jgi:hypothetical protein
MSSFTSAEDMSPPIPLGLSSCVALSPASPSPRASTTHCGHPVSNTSASTINLLAGELCTACELRAAIEHAAKVRIADDLDFAYEGMLAWRKCRLELANFECDIGGTDGCSADFEFTREQQEKFSRNWALLLVEGEEAEELRVEMEADEAEQRAVDVAAAAMELEMESEMGTGIATTTTDKHDQTTKNGEFAKANKSTHGSKPEPKNASAGRDSSPTINTAKRSLSVTFAASAEVDGDVDSHDHRDEGSYRLSSVYHRPSKKQKLYLRGRWAPPRSGWLDTSGSGVKDEEWERDAMDDSERVTVQKRRLRSSVVKH